MWRRAISLSDAVALVVARATVVDRLTGRYAMAVLGTGLDIAESLLADTPGWLEVSAVNGPSSTVVAGDHEAVAAAVRLAQQRGIFSQQLSVDYPGAHQRASTVAGSLAEADAEVGVPGRTGEVHRLHAGHRGG